MSFSDEHHEEPKWLHSEDRKLLQNPDLRTMATIVVAKDGSSTYNTITAALQAVPDQSDQRFVIYVKIGVYNENVEVGKNKWNVVMVGDGMTSTMVTGSLNFVDGTPTFKSATFGKIFVFKEFLYVIFG
jgi:pectin methylesterase-like acyl-CoA thioesterase